MVTMLDMVTVTTMVSKVSMVTETVYRCGYGYLVAMCDVLARVTIVLCVAMTVEMVTVVAVVTTKRIDINAPPWLQARLQVN